MQTTLLRIMHMNVDDDEPAVRYCCRDFWLTEAAVCIESGATQVQQMNECC